MMYVYLDVAKGQWASARSKPHVQRESHVTTSPNFPVDDNNPLHQLGDYCIPYDRAHRKDPQLNGFGRTLTTDQTSRKSAMRLSRLSHPNYR
jgi:hypothetical protein